MLALSSLNAAVQLSTPDALRGRVSSIYQMSSRGGPALGDTLVGAVAGVFGRHDVSIRSMEQEGLGGEARLVFITHVAREAAVRATIRELHHLDAVDRITSVLRVIGQ